MDTYYNTYDIEGNFKRKISSDRVKSDLEENEYLQGVSCVVIRDGKILFEKRSNTQDGSNLMDFCSGHIDNDEDPKTAMVRELGEELGIPQEIAEKVTKLKYYPLIAEKRQTQKKWFMTFFYLQIPNNLKLQLQESEVKKVDFLQIKEAFELIRECEELQFPYDANMEEMLKQLQVLLMEK